MIQSLFTKSKYAGIVAAVLYFMFSFVNLVFVGAPSPPSPTIEYMFCLVPQFNMF